jgi:uncharacterized membrane protein YuzA (DUF378 family)
MIEQVLVWIIVGVAAAYAVVTIVRSVRKSADHCSDCGLQEKKPGAGGKR